jgi:hypothetical protein
MSYTRGELRSALQVKVEKGLVNFILANPLETATREETPELSTFSVEVSVEDVPKVGTLRLIYVDIECNNFVKDKAVFGETRPVNFMPEVMEFPVLCDNSVVISSAHSFIRPVYFKVQPSIIKFCNFPHKTTNHLTGSQLEFDPPAELTVTFLVAFMKFARVKCQIGPFSQSCMVCEGDFDPMFLCGELLRENRARTVLRLLQMEFPNHQDLQKNFSDPQAVWTTIADILRFINFKDEFARFFPSNPDRTRNDLDYILEKLGLKFNDDEHHHSGKDDTRKVLEAYNELRNQVGLEKSAPLFVKSIRIVPIVSQ